MVFDMSDKEFKLLQEFKDRIQDVKQPEHDDTELWKWMKARSFNVDRAETMYRESMAYRKRMNIEALKQNYAIPEVLTKYMPGGFCGFDSDGSPVLVELYGHMDMRGIMASCKKSDIEKTKILMAEKVVQMLKDQSIKVKNKVTGMTVIIDMENVTTRMLWGPGIQMYAHMGKVMQDNYPEIVKRTFIINAPGIFPLLWKLFRPLVTEEMRQKVSVLGGTYQSELLKHIDKEQLPAFLGGSMVDKDGNPRCPSKICQGGTVPDNYYRNDISMTESLQELTLGSGRRQRIAMNVSVPGSVLSWEFKTEGHDIAFGVLFDDSKEVIKLERVKSHIIPEDGTYTCLTPGKYSVVFDNSYSWARSKHIFYKIDVLPPEDDVIVTELNNVTTGSTWGPNA